MKKYLALMMAACTLASCGSKKAEETANSKTLVLYYSQTGATQSVAEEIQKQLGADIEAIDVENPYTGDFNATIARCQEEMQKGELPTLKPIQSNLAAYDTIFLGYPVWFGTYAPPVSALLDAHDFEGKVVIPFCTFGSGGLQATVSSLKETLGKATVMDGYGVRNARIAKAPAEVERFLIEHNYKAGEVENLPAFMEHLPVSDADVDIFNQACGDYQFPLGTPVDVAIRECETSIDYEFTAMSRAQDGSETLTTIYVTVEKTEGAKPEFTMVVR